MLAESGRAFHITLDRNVYALFADPSLLQISQAKSHHDLRTANHSDSLRRIEACAGNQRCDGTDIAAPALACGYVVDGLFDLEVESAAPFFQLALKQDLVRCARAIK